MTLDIGIANRPCRGEKVSGDSWVTIPAENTLVVVADGLGHGPLAAEASVKFCDYTRDHSEDPLEPLIRRASKHISSSRGAAAAILRIHEAEERVSFAGVGNIELQAVSVNSIRPVCTPGIIGRPIRKIVEFGYELSTGDLIAMYSDGISSRFDLKEYRNLDAQECADTILKKHGKYHDDATCVVIRYRR